MSRGAPGDVRSLRGHLEVDLEIQLDEARQQNLVWLLPRAETIVQRQERSTGLRRQTLLPLRRRVKQIGGWRRWIPASPVDFADPRSIMSPRVVAHRRKEWQMRGRFGKVLAFVAAALVVPAIASAQGAI